MCIYLCMYVCMYVRVCAGEGCWVCILGLHVLTYICTCTLHPYRVLDAGDGEMHKRQPPRPRSSIIIFFPTSRCFVFASAPPTLLHPHPYVAARSWRQRRDCDFPWISATSQKTAERSDIMANPSIPRHLWQTDGPCYSCIEILLDCTCMDAGERFL